MDAKDLSVYEYKIPLSEFKSVPDTVKAALEALDEMLKKERYTVPYAYPEIDFFAISFVPSRGETWENEEVRVKIEFVSWADTSDRAGAFRI